jgi:ATP-dependent helicase/nuclease subunit B
MPSIKIPNHGMDAVLRGVVDRVDVWQRGDSSYFRVVDYKTGKKSFDYCDVFNGVGLQMLLYLFALEQAGNSVIDGKRISSGVQYFPARAPYVNVDGMMSDEEAQAVRKKYWKRSGLLLSDEDTLRAMDATEKLDILSCSILKDGSISGDVADRRQLGLLRDYIMERLAGMAEDIASGNVTPNPYTRGTSHNACTFCPYGSVCHEETVEDRRNYKSMTAQRFWEEIEKEAKNHG